jgi:hypothetical protein
MGAPPGWTRAQRAEEDLPGEFRSILVENGDGPGPFGAKGIGESGLMPTAPAIANALARAIGVRLKELPLASEHVRAAIAGTEAGVGQDVADCMEDYGRLIFCRTVPQYVKSGVASSSW